MVAVVTLFQMAIESSSPAGLDCGHNAALCHRHCSAMFLTIGFAVAAENIRYFQPRAVHFPRALGELGCSGLAFSDKRPWEQI
jgi:DMSO/TMAO reductase YedYZ heme-binding membrane subunit